MSSFATLTGPEVRMFAQAVADAAADCADARGITGGLSTMRFNVYAAITQAICEEWERLQPQERD